MQVYRAFLKILKKNLPAVSIYFFIFMGLTIAFSAGGKENDETQFEQEKLSVCVMNEDKGVLGNDLKEYIGSIHNLKKLKDDKETLQDALYNREVDYIIYIPEDFTERVLQGETTEILRTIKVPGGVAGVFVDTQIEQYLSTLQIYLKADFEEEDAASQAKKDLGIETTVKMLQGEKLIISEPDIKSSEGEKITNVEPASFYFRYLPYIFICITIMGLGPILLAFQKKEIYDRNNCSAMSLKSRNIQLILGCASFVIVCLILFMILATVMYPAYVFSTKGVLSFINAAVFILVALALTFVFSQFAKNSNILNMGSNTIGLGFSFLGGVFVPLEIMGDKVLQISRFTPTYWYVVANDKIQEIESLSNLPKIVYTSFGLQMIFAIAFLSIGLIITKRKQDNK